MYTRRNHFYEINELTMKDVSLAVQVCLGGTSKRTRQILNCRERNIRYVAGVRELVPRESSAAKLSQ
jgi:hypothetical protein